MERTLYYITNQFVKRSLNDEQWEAIRDAYGHGGTLLVLEPEQAENRRDTFFATMQAIQGQDRRGGDGAFQIIPALLSSRCRRAIEDMNERIVQHYLQKKRCEPADLVNCLRDMGRIADKRLTLDSPLVICYEDKVLSLREFLLQEAHFLAMSGQDRGVYYISDMRIWQR